MSKLFDDAKRNGLSKFLRELRTGSEVGMIWNDDTEETTGIIREEKYGRLKLTYVEIVRCKDCKDACIYSDDWVICTHIDSNGNDKHPADWFCADGRKRNDT